MAGANVIFTYLNRPFYSLVHLDSAAISPSVLLSAADQSSKEDVIHLYDCVKKAGMAHVSTCQERDKEFFESLTKPPSSLMERVWTQKVLVCFSAPGP